MHLDLLELSDLKNLQVSESVSSNDYLRPLLKFFILPSSAALLAYWAVNRLTQTASHAPDAASKHFTNVLFFPDAKSTCPAMLRCGECPNPACLYEHSETGLSSLVNYLTLAQSSIDVCVFTITSRELSDALVYKHKAGVVVRVVTDCEKADLNCSQIEQFREHGIQVRHDKTSFFMHNKFCIIDRQILINGSFNWTHQAVMGNRENLLICNIPEIVKPYRNEFAKLWKLYKPVPSCT